MLLVLLIGLIGSLIGGWYLRRTWDNIERIELAQQLSSASAGFTNYLIVGTDSRAGLDDSLESSDNIGLGVSGERSDTMVLLQRSPAGTSMMAVPRDLYVDVAGVGPERINAAVAFGGPEALIATVQTSLDVPVHHYLEVDLAGFLNVVDALGGVAIDFPCPVTDPKSGLDIPNAGEQILNAEQALAYVRARTYVETCPGQAAQADGRADLGRVERQQYFLNAVFSKVVSTRNPVTLVQVAGDVGEGLRIDDTLKLSETLRLGRSINSNPPETVVLPTTPFTTDGGAQVLDLGPGAQDVLESFRT